jgi:N-glycosylase/DNA lyase
MNVRYEAEGAVVRCGEFSLPRTLFCGQAFRWRKAGDSYCGVAGDTAIRALDRGDEVVFLGAGRELFSRVIAPYFDLDTDYAPMLCEILCDDALRRVAGAAAGIRILRQPPFEALVTFILSANNHIPRIAGIVERLCSICGERRGGINLFPTPEAILRHANRLCELRAGYRLPYVLDAAEAVERGRVDLDAVAAMPLAEAIRALLTIKGVGPKVADCALLYGFHRLEVFPVDVWISRAMHKLYPTGRPAAFVRYGGLAQQMLFYAMREAPEVFDAAQATASR